MSFNCFKDDFFVASVYSLKKYMEMSFFKPKTTLEALANTDKNYSFKPDG